MKSQAPKIYGVMAEFTTPEAVVEAAEHAYAEGYRRMDAYTPYPVDGLAEAIGFARNRMPLIVFIGGLIGGLGAYFMMWFSATIHYAFNVGGRPLNSWPAFVPVTFELTVLGASIAAVLGMLGLNGLPMPHHPVFNVPDFALASRNRFFLCVQSDDPKFDPVDTRDFLMSLKPKSVSDVPTSAGGEATGLGH